MAATTHQAGARHCADVSGTFSGLEFAPPVPDPQPQPKKPVYPLWERAAMDPETQVALLHLWERYGDLE